MSTYVIGDIQGCYKPFKQLLTLIKFRPQQDELWLTGDLVNRGPDSLSVLRFLMDLPKAPIVVLGNHDLHLLAVYSGQVTLRKKDTIQAVCEAADSDLIMQWLRHHPLVHFDRGYLLVHAGLPPQWTALNAREYAREVETVLTSDKADDFFAQMYGTQPNRWSSQLEGYERLRFMVNALTRIRFCTLDGELDFSETGELGSQKNDLYPWFAVPSRASENESIIFGHWAALQGQFQPPTLFGLDTGCVWGNALTALCLEDHRLFHVKCDQYKDIMIE